ncbi:MAG: serine/threonine protein kinase [Parachlamydiaceae bacterium]|nr:serine/threonine protein kinase [Parachlamydiaceae bacterium]
MFTDRFNPAATWMLLDQHNVRSAFGYSRANDSEPSCCNGGTYTHILGYLPGISLIVGVVRIIFAAKCYAFLKVTPEEGDKESIRKLKHHAFRGVIEATCILGIILLIVDMIATTCLKARNTVPVATPVAKPALKLRPSMDEQARLTASPALNNRFHRRLNSVDRTLDDFSTFMGRIRPCLPHHFVSATSRQTFNTSDPFLIMCHQFFSGYKLSKKKKKLANQLLIDKVSETTTPLTFKLAAEALQVLSPYFDESDKSVAARGGRSLAKGFMFHIHTKNTFIVQKDADKPLNLTFYDLTDPDLGLFQQGNHGNIYKAIQLSPSFDNEVVYKVSRRTWEKPKKKDEHELKELSEEQELSEKELKALADQQVLSQEAVEHDSKSLKAVNKDGSHMGLAKAPRYCVDYVDNTSNDDVGLHRTGFVHAITYDRSLESAVPKEEELESTAEKELETKEAADKGMVKATVSINLETGKETVLGNLVAKKTGQEDSNYSDTLDLSSSDTVRLVMPKDSSLPIPHLFEVARQLIAGALYLEKQGYIHTDMKSANCFLKYDDNKSDIVRCDHGDLSLLKFDQIPTKLNCTRIYFSKYFLATFEEAGKFAKTDVKSKARIAAQEKLNTVLKQIMPNAIGAILHELITGFLPSLNRSRDAVCNTALLKERLKERNERDMHSQLSEADLETFTSTFTNMIKGLLHLKKQLTLDQAGHMIKGIEKLFKMSSSATLEFAESKEDDNKEQ